jgi:dipeptidase D
MSVLNKLEPSAVWRHFDNICSIPHPSGYEDKIAAYILEQATSTGYEAFRDTAGNVIVKVPPTKGREDDRTLILQGHIDMVPVSVDTVEHDFMKDPIVPFIDGDFVRAKGTTLGADNGIGAAMMLAIMENNTPHGPLELLFTVNEESGMTGAKGIEEKNLTGKHLINLDTEEWGEIYVSCAGGADSIASLTFKREKSDSSDLPVNLKVTGLKGGHSGVDINLGRGNAIKITAAILDECRNRLKLRIIHFTGGSKRNAIPDTAEVIFSINKDSFNLLNEIIETHTEVIKAELSSNDPDMSVTLSKDERHNTEAPLTQKDTDRLLNMILAMPSGVIQMSTDVPGLVETSVNAGVLTMGENTAELTLLTRSAVSSAMDTVKRTIRAIANLAGAKIEEPEGYPGWKPNMNSELLALGKRVFMEEHNYEPEIKAIHAGLECGIFSEKLPGVDMISIGPDMADVHTPAEHLSISSVKKFYSYLEKLLLEFH